MNIESEVMKLINEVAVLNAQVGILWKVYAGSMVLIVSFIIKDIILGSLIKGKSNEEEKG